MTKTNYGHYLDINVFVGRFLLLHLSLYHCARCDIQHALPAFRAAVINVCAVLSRIKNNNQCTSTGTGTHNASMNCDNKFQINAAHWQQTNELARPIARFSGHQNVVHFLWLPWFIFIDFILVNDVKEWTRATRIHQTLNAHRMHCFKS